MNDEFKTYLESIDLTKVMIERIANICDFYQDVLTAKKDNIKDIFISEFIDNEGNRIYEDLWLFSDNYFLVSANFIGEDNFNIAYSFRTLKNLKIDKINYDFVKANDNSRLYIMYKKEYGFQGTLKASKENCNHLMEIFKKCLLPNLI
ncbi:MAG: hypothetical protein AB9879_01225 [Methanothrix sp.]